MTSFLDEIFALVRDVNLAKVKAPDGEVDEFEKVVGDFPDSAKRLWEVRNRLGSAMAEIAKEGLHSVAGLSVMDLGDDDKLTPRQEEIFAKLKLQNERKKAVDTLMWAEVHCAFPSTAGKSVGVRKGWKVVLRPLQLPPSLSALFGL